MRPVIAIILLGLIASSLPVIGQCVPPVITTQPKDTVACVGDSVTLWITSTGSHHDFIWHKDGTDIPGWNQPSYTIKSVTHADEGVYSVEVDNACGYQRSIRASLIVNDPPSITASPANETKCVGQTVTFSISVAGGGPYSIEWATPRSGGVWGPPNDTSITLDHLTVADAGSIAVRVTNACSSMASATSTLDMNDVPMLVDPPQGGAICAGGSFTLSVTAMGTPPMTYQWLKNGALIPGSVASTFQIHFAGANDEGLYQVIVTNACGSVFSPPAPVLMTVPTDRTWSAVSNGMNGPVFALQSFDDGTGGALYAGGAFTSAGGVPASRVARWVNGAWQPVGGGMNAPVHALGVFNLGAGPVLYAAGEFTMASGSPVNRIARWDGVAWQPLGAGIGNGTVRAMHTFSDGFGIRLYAGGTFTMAGPNGGLASWDGVAWTAVGGGVLGQVHALEVFDDGSGPKLFVGGGFGAGGGVPAQNLVRWDGSAFSTIGGPVPSDLVRVLLTYDEGQGAALYVGGDFQGFNGLNGIGRWDGSAWSALGAGLGVGPVYALASYDDGTGPGLFAGGNFTMSGLDLVHRVARWQNGAWSEVNMGRDDLVRAIAVHVTNGCADLFTGGFFFHAGGELVNFVARWKAHFTLELSQPLGSGSLAVTNAFGDPAANYFTAFSFDPGNAKFPGGGPWFGLFITIDDLIAQFSFGTPPFVGNLNQVGVSFFTLPPGAISNLAGVQAWGLTVMYDPILLVPGLPTQIATLTIQ